MNLDTLKQILDLGWPALVTVAVVVMWTRYTKSVDEEIAYLRKRIDELESKVRAAVERMS